METIEDLPVLEELDAEPAIEELSKAIDALSSGKAPGDLLTFHWIFSPTETIPCTTMHMLERRQRPPAYS